MGFFELSKYKLLFHTFNLPSSFQNKETCLTHKKSVGSKYKCLTIAKAQSAKNYHVIPNMKGSLANTETVATYFLPWHFYVWITLFDNNKLFFNLSNLQTYPVICGLFVKNMFYLSGPSQSTRSSDTLKFLCIKFIPKFDFAFYSNQKQFKQFP